MTTTPQLTPTPEQEQALELYRAGGNLAIEAGAGTGKTSTLTLLAHDAERLGQYVAFNKAIVADAGGKMPGHVLCSTAHSLAFRSVGVRYAHRLRGAKRLKSMEIARRLHIAPLIIRYGSESKPMSAGYLAGYVMRAVGNFCQSADLEPDTRHFPYIDGIDVPFPDGRRTYTNNNEVRYHCLPALKAAWADIASEHGQLPFKHDHYLKLWHLNSPLIPADVIYFDEAQDANPVLLAIVSAQSHAQLVFVGDTNQQIYEFTGAVNALANVPADHRAMLTQSFRFGPAVADVANGILGRLESAMRLRGSAAITSVVGPVPMPDAVLCRTNAAAMERLMEELDNERAAHLVGGGAEVSSFAKAAADLQAGRWVSHPDLACFSDWGAVQDYVAHDEQGGELRLMVNLIDNFGAAAIISALERSASEAAADVVISTAHKAKGREWGSVALASDFRAPKDGGELSPQELRLLYVAVTRARRELDVSACPDVMHAPEQELALPPAITEEVGA